MPTIARNRRRRIAELTTALTWATRHAGSRDATGTPEEPERAWQAYHENRYAKLTELDHDRLYEIRISGTERYLLRPNAPAQNTARVDIVLDPDPEVTFARVFIGGEEVPFASIHLHILEGLDQAAASAAAENAPDTVLASIHEHFAQ